MIPSRQQCLALWDKYNLPSQKRIHVEEVTKLANYFVEKLSASRLSVKQINLQIAVNKELLEAAALLHDIDKNIKPKPGERHPDTAVRILTELGFMEVAEVIKKHPLHAILDPQITPTTWEEKILFLADKMTKYEVVGVNARFKLWYAEHLPASEVVILNKAYPLVKNLEKEIFTATGCNLSTVL